MDRLFKSRRALGRTGFIASQLGIGDLADRSLGLRQCADTLRRAMDAGLNVIDTAPAYEDGFSEQVVGAALAGRREGMFVITKIDHLDQPVVPQVEGSLERLGLDSVDLLLFHGVSRVQDWQRLAAPGSGLDQLAQIIRQGKCRFAGLSSHHPDVLRLAIESGRCDALMFALGPFSDARYSEEILPQARAAGVATLGFKVFGAGMLLGDTSGYGRPLAADRSGGLPRLSVPQCLHYTLTLDPDVALLGMSTPAEQDAAFEAAKTFAPLSADQMAEIRAQAAAAVAGKGTCWWNPEKQL
ncbi:MAG: aldo/keto reductase [Planctomycetaceae bacterium]|nr:aldo/keto reductase [Planctomycetaceae bacterium]